MYDARQEPNEFVANNLKEARAKAATFFGMDEGDLKIVVPKDGAVYGTGGQTVIVAVPKEIAARGPQSGGGDGPRREDRGPRRESRNERGPRGNGGDRSERSARPARSERSDRGERSERSERAPRGEGRGRPSARRERGGEREEKRDAPKDRLEPEVAKSVANSKGVAVGDIGPIGEFLLGAVEKMKIGSFEISESSEGDYLIFQLKGAAAEALQSGDGRAIDALQLVANQVSMRQSDDAPRIVVDVEGGGDEREVTMGRLADRAVKRARETGRSIALDPMNSRDRRAIHVELRDVEGIATMSIGEGRYRQVLVVPEGAPEYDDAIDEGS
jgi:spoIIIJ-associated protein